MSDASNPAPGAEFNVGVDVEDISRFEDAGEHLLALFSAEELADTDQNRRATRLTSTWCAKEATVKALWPWVHLDPRRVSVRRDPDGRPHVAVTGWDLETVGVQVRVSISHTSTVATAVAVVWGPSAAQESSSEGDVRE